jgi:hypothetical protein
VIPFSDEGKLGQETNISWSFEDYEAIRTVSKITSESFFNWCGDQIEKGITDRFELRRHVDDEVLSSADSEPDTPGIKIIHT